MDRDAPTVPSLKQAFITAQTNLLSQPIGPSRVWHRNNNTSDQPIPTRIFEDALFSLNQIVQVHCRRVYPPQASYNVAEQISNSYSRDAEARVNSLKEEADGNLGRELDLAADDAIESLPPSWPTERDITSNPAEAERYEEIVLRLSQLSERRRGLRQRVEKLRRVKAAVEPLRESDTDDSGIQDNLVTRDGPVEKELERMRALLARVTGRVADLPVDDGAAAAAGTTIDLADITKAKKRNVDAFLSDPRVFPS